MLGVITGLAAEAKIAARWGDKAIVHYTAAIAAKADYAIQKLLASGITRLMSFGIAGGLAPDLAAGDVVIASQIGNDQGAWQCDATWGAALQVAVPQAKLAAVWGDNHVVPTLAHKQKLHQAGYAVCDMESHHVAKAATQAGIDFIAVRVVCDPANFTLPAAALVPLRPNGTPDYGGVIMALAKQPSQLPALLTLARHNQTAMNALARINL